MTSLNDRPVVRFARFVVIGAIVTAAAGAGAQTQPSTASAPATMPALRFHLGPDTTVITEPLLPNGLPDYLGAINARFGRGVTPANNAAVPLLRAMDPRYALNESIRERTYEQLGMQAPPADGTHFQDFPGAVRDESYQAALENLWQAEQYPAVADWLKRNEAPLALFAEASQRSRYFIPLVGDPEKPITGALLPSLAQYRHMAKAMVIRANLAAGEGRIDDAWADLLACCRLGGLVAQDSMLIGRLVGISVANLANDATARLAASGKLDAAQASRMMRDLRAIPAGISAIPAVQTEHFITLDAICRLALHPEQVGYLVDWLPWDDAEDQQRALAKRRAETLVSGVDIDDTLRRAIRAHDRLVAVMESDTYAQFRQAQERFDQALDKMRADARAFLLDEAAASAVGQPSDQSPWLPDLMLSLLMRSLARAEMLARQQEVRRDMAIVALALNGYRAEAGAYPDSLDALVPTWLEKVPADFFSAKPLAYRAADGGYALYSYSFNGRDDGGRNDDRGSNGMAPDDVAYTAGR